MFITELHAKGGNGEKFTSYVPSDRGIDLIIRNRINIPGVPTKTKKCLKTVLKMVTFSKMASIQSRFKQFFSYFLIQCPLPCPIHRQLARRPFRLLNNGCTCQWNGIVIPLLPSKQVQSCPIDFACRAVLAIHGDDKLLKDLEGCIFCDSWQSFLKIGLTPGLTSHARHAGLMSTMAAILKTGGRYV